MAGSEATDVASRHPDEVSRIHHQLRQWILVGELRPGDTLSQVDLAAQLGVSRGPLREALRMLQREGFVQQESQRRARVANFSCDDLDELYAMRVSLESLAISLSAPRLTDEQMGSLETHLTAMKDAIAAGDLVRWERPHVEFHRILVSPSGNRLKRDIALLADHATRYKLAFATWIPREWESGLAEHEVIAAAMRARDPDAAASALAAHLGRTALILLSILSPAFEPLRIRRALVQASAAEFEIPRLPQTG